MALQHLSSVCIETCKCAGVFARDALLQSALLESGVLWHLIIFLFNYDYTLDEATGINADAATHETEMKNRVAKKAVSALRKLAGFGGYVRRPSLLKKRKMQYSLALSSGDNGNIQQVLVASPTSENGPLNDETGAMLIQNGVPSANGLTNGTASHPNEEQLEVMSGGTGGEEGSGDEQMNELNDVIDNDE